MLHRFDGLAASEVLMLLSSYKWSPHATKQLQYVTALEPTSKVSDWDWTVYSAMVAIIVNALSYLEGQFRG